MIKWWRKRRLQRLEEMLAMRQAMIDVESDAERRSGTFYPMVREKNAAEKARLMFQIERIKEKK